MFVGFVDSAPHKLNQDTYCIHENFGEDPNQAFFGVFDGHGKVGTECSHFVRKELPKVLLNVMKKRPNRTLKENLVAAHMNTNTMVMAVRTSFCHLIPLLMFLFHFPIMFAVTFRFEN
jgi:serine/threonine protein phosphatase PrpC